MAKRARTRTATAAPAGTTELKSLAALMDMNLGDIEPATGGGAFPEGKSQTCIIESVEVTETKEAKLPMVAWVLAGTSEGIEGKKDYKNDVLRGKQSLEFLRRDMEAIGLEWPSDGDAIGEALIPAVGMEIKVDVKDTQKDEYEYHNIYFRDVIGDAPNAATASTPDPATDTAPEEHVPTKDELRALGVSADGEDEAAMDELIALGAEFAPSPILDADFDTWAEMATELMEAYGL